MQIDQVIVLLIGLSLIGLIIWWFFGKSNKQSVQASLSGDEQVAEITVDGGYTPNVVTLKSGVPAKLIFNRKSASSCFDEVVLPDFGIREKLPIGEKHTIEITPSQPGEYQYACGMNMFFGKLEVK